VQGTVVFIKKHIAIGALWNVLDNAIFDIRLQLGEVKNKVSGEVPPSNLFS
jgi:hypothetical protein